ncbi:macro domain-containing protein [Floccifex sp.]|uniref:macro domain-containing protein n=1 Tax=Floccifex sp. TaxID=2815810 RepID=UPI002A761D18|nr:macro domain-containing protein [Floccifex sp.]MDD7280542.1 macro domain-containing protein [Erysipelotrichaceae bacterium]MDY2958158.1 macro domain-containing protein [Floccifex sp.]
MIQIINKNIIDISADAIVNAANEQLLQGGGVCGAIFSQAGSTQLQQACNCIGYCPTGKAVITPGFNTKAKYIIHAVGPIYKANDPVIPDLLYSAYQNSLKLAQQYECQSIVFPLISAGIYGYPIQEAWNIAIQAILDFEWDDIDVIFAILDKEIMKVGQNILKDSLRK